jgi:hypothetical protein
MVGRTTSSATSGEPKGHAETQKANSARDRVLIRASGERAVNSKRALIVGKYKGRTQLAVKRT